MKISVILPCKNEEQTIGICIQKIKKSLKNKDYEIIIQTIFSGFFLSILGIKEE